MDALPAELVICVLERLDQNGLWSAAAVSRRLYRSAWSAGLYIHLNVAWRDTGSLARRSEIVQHARHKGLRLSLSISLLKVRLGNTLYDPRSSSSALKALALVDAALPILVYLSVCVTETLFPDLAAVLCHPAPYIACFSLRVVGSGYSTPVLQLPVDLFVASAPKLCRLELEDVALGNDIVAAFALVHSVSLAYTGDFPYIDCARHFPRLRILYLCYSGGNPDSSRPTLMLAGVHLRRLTVEDDDTHSLMPAVLQATDVGAIASVVHNTNKIAWDDPVWSRAGDDGLLSVQMTRHVVQQTYLGVLVVPENRRWRREYNLHWTLADEFPIRTLPGLGERLAYLCLENRLIPSLLRCDGLALGALRALCVDFGYSLYYPRERLAEMVWPPDWLHRRYGFSFNEDFDGSGPVFSSPSYSTVSCPARQQLTLATCDEGISLASEEIAFLGRALSQCERPAQARAVLVLAGTSMKTPVAQALLEQTFSAVLEDGESLLEHDAGFWDDIV